MEQAQQLDGEERIIQARTVLNAVQMSMDSHSPQSRAEAEAALRNWVGYSLCLLLSTWQCLGRLQHCYLMVLSSILCLDDLSAVVVLVAGV